MKQIIGVLATLVLALLGATLFLQSLLLKVVLLNFALLTGFKNYLTFFPVKQIKESGFSILLSINSLVLVHLPLSLLALFEPLEIDSRVVSSHETSIVLVLMGLALSTETYLVTFAPEDSYLETVLKKNSKHNTLGAILALGVGLGWSNLWTRLVAATPALLTKNSERFQTYHKVFVVIQTLHLVKTLVVCSLFLVTEDLLWSLVSRVIGNKATHSVLYLFLDLATPYPYSVASQVAEVLSFAVLHIFYFWETSEFTKVTSK